MGKKKKLRKEEKTKDKKALQDPWARLMDGADAVGTPQRAQAWELAVRRALRNRQGLADFLDKVHDVPDLPHNPDAAFLKHLADYCRFGAPPPEDHNVEGLSRAAAMMADVLKESAVNFPAPAAMKLLGTFPTTPEKVMPRHYRDLAGALAGHPTIPGILEKLGDLLGKLRALNHKRSVQDGAKLLSRSRHFRKIDDQVRTSAQPLPENLALLLLHPLRCQVFEASRRMAQDFPGSKLKGWLDAFPFLMKDAPKLELDPILELLDPPVPTRERLRALRKQIPSKSMEETAALIPLLRRWDRELDARVNEIVMGQRPFDLDPEVGFLLLAAMADVYMHLIQRLLSELEGADPRERARCGALMESQVLKDMDFLEDGFPSQEKFLAFLEKILELGPRHPQLPLLYAGLCQAEGLTKRRRKALEALQKTEPLSIQDVEWSFEPAKDPLFHLHVLDIFLACPQAEVVDEYIRRVARRLRQSFHMKFLEQLEAQTRAPMPFRLPDEPTGGYPKKLKAVLRRIDSPFAEPLRDLLESFPGGIWSEEGYGRWLETLARKNNLAGAVETVTTDLRRFMSGVEGWRPEEAVTTAVFLGEIQFFLAWILDHIQEALSQVAGALADFFDALDPLWEHMEVDSTVLIRIHNALEQWDGPKSREMRNLAQRVRSLLRRAARPPKSGGPRQSKRFGGKR